MIYQFPICTVFQDNILTKNKKWQNKATGNYFSNLRFVARVSLLVCQFEDTLKT